MNVGNSVRKAIDDFELHDIEASMLHACNAIDGTAKKVYQTLRNNARFTRLLRDNYGILGPMGIPGIDIVLTRFPVRIGNPTSADGLPDLADVIYGVHRCSHGHGDDLPDGFQLHSDAASNSVATRVTVVNGAVRLTDRIIFGMLAVAVMSPVNRAQRVPDSYYLTYEGRQFPINQWWGHAVEYQAILAQTQLPNVKLNFGDWML